MRRRVTAIATAAVLLGLMGTLPATAADPVKVLSTSADELSPAASTDYLAWIQRDGSKVVVYAKPFDGARMRVSAIGYSASPGSIEGTTLIYQQYSVAKGISDIYRFDLVTKRRTKLPSPINTKHWEHSPTGSGDMIAFTRLYPTDESRLILYDMASENARTLVSTPGARVGVWAGQMRGNWLTFQKLVFDGRGGLKSCEVFLYDIAARTTSKVPNPDGRCHYASSVDLSGTVYFARSALACGKNVSLRAYPVGGPETKVISLTDPQEINVTSAVDTPGGTEVYYDLFRCRPSGYVGPSDIYKVTP